MKLSLRRTAPPAPAAAGATSGARPQPAPRRRRPRWLRPVVVVALILAVGLTLKLTLGRKQAEPDGVRTGQVTRGNLEQSISSTGTVAAETGAYVKIGSQISGRIRSLYADLGSRVQAGQVIAEIDAPDLAANLEAAQRNLAGAEARYQQELQGVSAQHTQLTGAFEQSGAGVQRAEAQRDQARSAIASAETRLRSATSGVASAEARVRSAEAQLRSARASAERQPLQTSSEVTRAQAALATAQAQLRQARTSADLSVASADASVKQAQANAALAAATVQRQQSLLDKGFISAQEVDQARTQSEVARQQLESARANLDLTREKVAADLQAAQDGVTSAQAALESAKAGSYADLVSTEAVRSAEASLAESRSGLSQAEDSVASARADVSSAKSALAAAESEIRSARSAQQTALGNLTQDRVKQQQVKAAFEARMQAAAQVALQQAQFAKSYIKTPISGTVVTLAQQQGETVAAGLSAPTLIEVVDLERLEVSAYVDETDIGQVRLDQTAKVTVDAYPDQEFTGRVAKIASAATMQNNVVTYLVTISLDKYPPGALKPTMTASVTISLAHQDNVLLVPNEAVKQKKDGTFVVVLKDGKPDVRTVTTGMTDGTSTEVKEGLQEGEELVLAGFDKLGLAEFSGGAQMPRFFSRGPLGIGGSSQRSGSSGSRSSGGSGSRSSGSSGSRSSGSSGSRSSGSSGSRSSGSSGSRSSGSSGSRSSGSSGSRSSGGGGGAPPPPPPGG